MDAPSATIAESTHYLLAVFGQTTNVQVALRATTIAPGPFPPEEITATAFANATAFILTPTATATLDPMFTLTPTETLVPTITPVPSVTPAGLGIVIASQPIEVRSAPGTEASAIDLVNPVTRVFVLAQNDDGTWLLIRLSNGREGWVPASALRFQR